MKIILHGLQQLYRRIFRGKKPSPKMKPQTIEASGKGPSKERGNTPTKAEPKEERSTFWQDKLHSDAADKKRAFYEKYRSRLQNQDRDISPKH